MSIKIKKKGEKSMKYKRVDTVDAIQWTGKNFEKVMDFIHNIYNTAECASDLKFVKCNSSTEMLTFQDADTGLYTFIDLGDYLVYENLLGGYFFNCAPGIFEKKFKSVDNCVNENNEHCGASDKDQILEAFYYGGLSGVYNLGKGKR